MLVYDGQDWRPFSVGLPGFPFADTRLTYEDRKGNIWVGLWGGGLVFCDPVRVQRYTEADGLPNCEGRCLEEDREGRMWIGTARDLACLEDDRLRPVEKGWAVSALVVDQQGQLWSGGPDGQVFKGTGTETQVIEVAEGGHEEITGLCPDRVGGMSVCTSEGRFGWIKEDASASPVEQGAEGEDEKQQIIAALQRTNWVVSGDRGAARLLGMSAQTLRYRMRKYGVQRPKKSS